ncbi:cell surface glycoprotein CD200 receptor 1 [Stegastes partitus]|uniref:Cell surface glycoprotein CD200 receptor 1 n=1 Tax=Stegastes partitus TaxID=144197 RepID=A0A9Y4NGS9_9TELE|nr:PREDICTED: cell surface glycoprotein CD200 receptor 1 [Stegastes partitus]
MRDAMWIYVVIVFMAEAAWSLDPETNDRTSANSSTASNQPKIYVRRNAMFNPGSDVNLTCSSKMWNETLFVIWKLDLTYKKCDISFSNDGRNGDSCNDGKSLRNTSSAQSYLHIPNFSTRDVGLYTCESVFKGGNENYIISVAITVPPVTSFELEQRGNKTVAVCKAERGNPAANISWSHTGNLLFEETRLVSNGFFTAESHLEVPEGMDTQNLSCIIRHPSWEREKILEPEFKKAEARFPWTRILIVVAAILFAGLVFFAQRKLMLLRPCRQSHNSPSKTPPIEDVEEVEPYASYIQRVNSIYN